MPSSARKPQALIILDGFGYRKEVEGNAIAQAATPNLDAWLTQYPWTTLQAHGGAVGILPNQLANSEVGHTALGSGRITKQIGTILHNAIANRTLFTHPMLVEAFTRLRESGKALHVMGLLSDAGVHATTEFLYAILEMASLHGVRAIYVHPFLDGRDVSVQSASSYLEKLERFMEHHPQVHLGSLHGRFYTMDRDNNWKRTEQSYHVLTNPSQHTAPSWLDVLTTSYRQGLTDEFIVPIQLDSSATVRDGDSIICCNFRPDRSRQMARAFVDEDFSAFSRKPLSLSSFITPVRYGSDIVTDVLYEYPPARGGLMATLDANGYSLFSIAETEKYAHITYFFNEEREEKFPHETRVLIPSLHPRTYKDYPEMSAAGITSAVLDSLEDAQRDFYLINYANADMVGHSGDMQATMLAIECLDRELKKLYDAIVIDRGGTLYITADHGNAEEMIDEKTGGPKTSHTNNPVLFLVLHNPPLEHQKLAHMKGLSDVAPFILKQMGLKE